jgi:hypothetical protein
VVAAYLLGEGLLVANRGRLDNCVPVVAGVANARRTPVFSREVSRLPIRSRIPRVSSVERYDYLVTIASNQNVDAVNAPRFDLSVIVLEELVDALSTCSIQAQSQYAMIQLFSDLARPATHIVPDSTCTIDSQTIAELCIRAVVALSG